MPLLVSRKRLTALLAAAEILAVTTFFARYLPALMPQWKRLPAFPVFQFAVALLMGALAWVALGRAAASFAATHALPLDLVHSKWSIGATPLLLLALDLVQEKYVLRDMAPTLLLLAAIGTAYLQIIFHNELVPSRQPPQTHPEPVSHDEPSRRRRAFWAVLLASFSIYSFILLSGILPSLPFTGDEPHYLLVAKSMVRDGDIDLYNNFQNKDYWEFYPGELSRRHVHPGRKGPVHIYSQHFPGLPLLLAPAYWFGDRLGKVLKIPGINAPNERNIRVLLARETMVLMTALLAAWFFLMVWEFSRNRRQAYGAWFIFAFTPPFLFYSRLLYSEIPVALALLLVFRQALFKRPASHRSLFWSGVGIAVIPWFGIKYIVLALAIFVIFTGWQWQSLFNRQRNFLFFLVPLFFSAILFIAFFLHIYGTIAPAAVYHGTAAGKGLFSTLNLPFGKINYGFRLLALLLDQRMGLLIYSPLYLLFIPGLVLMARTNKKIVFTALTLAVPYWLFNAYMQAYSGYAPPERILIPVAFILAFFASSALAGAGNRSAPFLFRILALAAIWVVYLALVQPGLFYHYGLSDSWNIDTQSNMLLFLSNIGVDLTRFVPNLSYLPAFSWPVLFLWLALIAVVTFVALKKTGNGVPAAAASVRHAFGVFLLALLLAAYHFFSVRTDVNRQMAVAGGSVFFQDENALPPEPNGFWIRGDSRSEIVLKTAAPLRALRLEMRSLGPLQVTVANGRQRAGGRLSPQTDFSAALILPEPRGIPWQRQHLYLLGFDVVGGHVPREIDPANRDDRRMGVFVRLFPVPQ